MNDRAAEYMRENLGTKPAPSLRQLLPGNRRERRARESEWKRARKKAARRAA